MSLHAILQWIILHLILSPNVPFQYTQLPCTTLCYHQRFFIPTCKTTMKTQKQIHLYIFPPPLMKKQNNQLCLVYLTPWQHSSYFTTKQSLLSLHHLPKCEQFTKAQSTSKNNSLHCFITDHQVDVYGMSEVNVAWHHINFHKWLGSCMSEWFESCHIMTAWNQQKSFQTAAQTGPSGIIWMWPIRSQSLDVLGKNKYHTCIVTCYHLVKNEKGSLSIFTQHHHYFLQHNVDQCPLQEYVIDLQCKIEQWQEDGNILIVGGDWNEKVSSPPWHAFWHNLGLLSLHRLINHLPTASYNCGSKQLDMVYLSPSLHKVDCRYLSCNDTILVPIIPHCGSVYQHFFAFTSPSPTHCQGPMAKIWESIGSWQLLQLV